MFCRLLNMTTQYPEALILITLHTITQVGDYNLAVDKLSELNQVCFCLKVFFITF